jgi:hypothetical protein
MATQLLSLAGLVGSPLTLGSRTGRITDVVARPSTNDTYPEVVALIVRIGRQLHALAPAEVDGLGSGRVLTARTDGDEYQQATDDVLLAADVLDRQIVGADGVEMVRAADLYLAWCGGSLRLVALDTSVRALVRRLGPRRLTARDLAEREVLRTLRRLDLRRPVTAPLPRRVIDWSDMDSVGGTALTLAAPAAEVRRVAGRDLTAALAVLEAAA